MEQKKPDMSDKFLGLLLPNQKKIMAYILSNVPHYAAAEDILQNTISILWKKYDAYVPETNFMMWAISVARYEIMTYYRKCQKDEKLVFNEALRQMLERESAFRSPHLDDRLNALQACVKKLSHDQSKLIKLRYEQELSFSKIGEQMGISSAAVFKKVSLIHSRLVQCIRLTLSGGAKA